MGSPTQYSASLVLSKDDTQFARRVSEKMKLDFGEFIPHVTIHFFDEKPISVPPETVIDVEVINTYFGVDAKERVWVGLAIKKTTRLVELYTSMANAAGLMVDSDDFFPHVTLGCIDGAALSSVDLRAIAGVDKEYILKGCRLVACRNGELGKVVEVLS